MSFDATKEFSSWDMEALENETKRLIQNARRAPSRGVGAPYAASLNSGGGGAGGRKTANGTGTGKKDRDRDLPSAKKSKRKTMRFNGSGTMPLEAAGGGGMDMGDTVDLGRTRNLFSASESRVTVEVLDDASPDTTPRGLDDLKAQKMRAMMMADNSAQLREIRTAEETYRSIQFGQEKSRVASKADTFVPAPTVSLDDVKRERSRLDKLEDSARTKKLQYSSEASHRREMLAHDRAAAKIQSLFRGHIGRQKFTLSRRLKDLDSTGGEWIEVRDRQSGDVWYYNKKSGVSQWERPDEMANKLLPDANVKKLPVIADARLEQYTRHGLGVSASASASASNIFVDRERSRTAPAGAARIKIPVSTLPSIDATSRAKTAALLKRSASASKLLGSVEEKGESQYHEDGGLEYENEEGQLGLGDEENTHLKSGRTTPLVIGRDDYNRVAKEIEAEHERGARKEVEQIMGTDRLTPATNIMAPDGHFKPSLREAILDAVIPSRFDAVSTVLADSRWAQASEDPILAMNSRPATTSQLNNGGDGKLDRSRRPMAAVLNLKSLKKKKIKQLEVDRYADLEAGGGSGGRGDRLLRKVEQGGAGGKKLLGDESDVLTTASKELTMKYVEHPEISSGNGTYNPLIEPMCFGCWSSGSKNKCQLHSGDRKLKSSETMLLCRNWDLSIMRRRYRAEELQEVYMRRTPSLRFNVKRKAFLTTVESRHQIYRGLNHLVESFNQRSVRWAKAKYWMHSFAEELRMGNIKPSKTKDVVAKIHARRNKKLYVQVSNFWMQIKSLLPIAPITGYSWPERIGEEQYLFKHPDQVLGQDVELILVEPVPVPQHLYQPRQYHLPTPQSIPMPRPDYKETDEKGGSVNFFPSLEVIDVDSPAAWLERMSSAIARDALKSAGEQIRAVTPIPGLERIRRTKEPPVCVIKFATMGRKPTPGNIAVGGLPVELLVYQLISTFIPTQYGSLMVMDKSAISPGVSPEVAITFESRPVHPVGQPFCLRPVEHPLNYRRTPAITINSHCIPDDRHKYGLNRPEQTGEQESHGFRTTSWAVSLQPSDATHPQVFTPSTEVASLNAPRANVSRTTHADITYPFCEPSTRDNTTLDFYHLLIMGVVSFSKPQVFTAMTTQECGQFLSKYRSDLPVGHLVIHVYRSWAFVQRDPVQEFKTDDGVSYWYHRGTGQTFWERPVFEEEKQPWLKGGITYDVNSVDQPHEVHRGVEGSEPRLTQGQFRKTMVGHHEIEREAVSRRTATASSAAAARVKGILPDRPGMSSTDSEFKEIDVQRLKNAQQIERAGLNDSAAPGKTANAKASENANHTAASDSTFSMGPKAGALWPKSKATEAAMQGIGIAPDSPSSQGSPSFRSPVSSPSRPRSPEMLGGGGISGLSPSYQQYGGGQRVMMSGTMIDPDVVASLSQSIGQVLSSMPLNNANPQDMINLGLGMGLALMQSGAFQNFGSNFPAGDTLSQISEPVPEKKSMFPTLSEAEYNTIQTNQVYTPTASAVGVAQKGGEPIGSSKPTVVFSAAKKLDHDEEQLQKEFTSTMLSRPLNGLEEAQEILVQPPVPTETPDLYTRMALTTAQPMNVDEALKAKIPVLVYPELSTQGGQTEGFQTHGPAGLGSTFVLTQEESHSMTRVGGNESLHRLGEGLPVGFFEAIGSTHVAGQEVDYLPQVPNLPQARTVGRIRPRSVAADWLAIAFDPWSAGKSPLNTEFIPSLSSKMEKMVPGGPMAAREAEAELRRQAKSKDAFINLQDEEGHTELQKLITQGDILEADFKNVASMCRHGKFSEVEEMMCQPDWRLPIDYQDAHGNTLLHIVCQNGNKRLVKLCLRRAAPINQQNLNGQTPLHFVYGYGYSSLGEYLIKKGADDSIRNKDGLTCYEGIDVRDLQQL